MAFMAYLTIKGQKQGKISSHSTQGDPWKIPILSMEEEKNVVDSSRMMVTGRRAYKPIVIVKECDAASPKLLQMAATNESLTVTFEFGNSATEVKNLWIGKIKKLPPRASGGPFLEAIWLQAAGDNREWDRVHFTYGQITWTGPNGNKSAQDTWDAK